jgi:hypothetical protein
MISTGEVQPELLTKASIMANVIVPIMS